MLALAWGELTLQTFVLDWRGEKDRPSELEVVLDGQQINVSWAYSQGKIQVEFAEGIRLEAGQRLIIRTR
jgi:hypothetical protein